MRALTGQKYVNNFIFTAAHVAKTDAAVEEVREQLEACTDRVQAERLRRRAHEADNPR